MKSLAALVSLINYCVILTPKTSTFTASELSRADYCAQGLTETIFPNVLFILNHTRLFGP
jgi:hypothetical protein